MPATLIRTMDEFYERFLPVEHERRKVEAMTPAERGRYIAQKSLAKANS